ncbi:AAA family ATPase [Flavobacterium aquidurense]|uniref:AAA family ATPase n=1 Tax=Flavobacterium aquidurense TaxID=362413 RepID=UPI003756972A
MFFFHNNQNIDLLENSRSDEDVNILVGINGSGKSTYLNEIAKHHLKRGKTVIAIANTIYDKFTIKGSRAKLLKSSHGKNIAKHSIKEVLKVLESDNIKAFFNLSNVFNYINLQPRIEFKINNLNPDFRDIIINTSAFNKEEIEDLLYFLNRSYDYSLIENEGKFILDFDKNNEFDAFRNVFFLKVLNYESKLKKLKILKDIEITLFKNNHSFPLNHASSGELTLIASLMYISVNITDSSIILIDEPENSLHPKWQVEYVKKLSELFYFYQPKIIIATHSPLVINGAELNITNVNIFKGSSFGQFNKQNKELKNVEEIYDNYFDLTTPENRFISQLVIEKFNLLSEGKISYTNFQNILYDLIQNSYDNQQKQALSGILELASKYS